MAQQFVAAVGQFRNPDTPAQGHEREIPVQRGRTPTIFESVFRDEARVISRLERLQVREEAANV